MDGAKFLEFHFSKIYCRRVRKTAVKVDIISVRLSGRRNGTILLSLNGFSWNFIVT